MGLRLFGPILIILFPAIALWLPGVMQALTVPASMEGILS
jgi:hypothetical protein